MTNRSVSGFSVNRWAAWAPGLEQQENWLPWQCAPYLPFGEMAPAATHIPPLLKRRTQRLGRMALEVLARIQENCPPDTPLVFASRHGETLRSLSLMRELASEGGISPQAFSLSVHNATIGIHTIICSSHANVTALAGGQACGYALLAEALGLLQEGAPSVVIVACDETLPDCYQPYCDEPSTAFAWAVELKAGDALNLGLYTSRNVNPQLPNLLDTLHFLLKTGRAGQRTSQQQDIATGLATC